MVISAKSFDFPDALLLGEFVPGSPEWHEARRGAIGGSQVGTILGLNPWESAVTCFLKLTEQIPSEITPSMSMRLGTKLEAPILEIFSEEHPELELFTTGTYRSKKFGWAHANPDAIAVGPDSEMTIIEVKYSGEYWSEPPRHYVAQVSWYMWVTGVRRAVIVALCGSSYREFVIEYDSWVVDSMIDQVQKFWIDTLDGIKPSWDGSESTYESMRQLNKTIDDGEVDLGDLGMYLVLAADTLEEAQKTFNELRSRTLDALGSAKWGLVEDERICSRQNSSTGSPYLKLVKRGK